MTDEEKEKHNKAKKKLKRAGVVMIVVGVVCEVVGVSDFITTFSTEGFPVLFFLCFIGLPLIAFGTGLILFSCRREILRFTKNEVVPVVNEAGEELRPAVKAVTSALREGLMGEQKPEVQKVCPKCGANNQPKNKFCDKCGSPLVKVCPKCGAVQDGDDIFCGECGAKLD